MLTQNRQRRVSAGLTALAAVAAISLSACSSSGSGSSGSSASAGSGGGTATSSNSGVAAAQAFLKQYSTPPTKLNLTTPLTAKPATGKTLVWMQCDAAQCAEETTFFKQAVKAVGWNLKIVNYATANPATLVSGLNQALQYKPTAVSLVGLPYAVWSSVVPAYKAAGVAILPMYVGTVPISSTIPANTAQPSDFALWGKLLANWFISDSNGSGEALYVNVPELAPSPSIAGAFTQTVKAGCSKCKITTLTQNYADVAAGKEPAAVVSALQKDPSIKYVISSEQPLSAGVSQAVSAAGISGIKYAGTSGEKTEEAQVKSGQLSAVTPTALNFATWLVVDAALRVAAGTPQPPATALNTMLITKSSNVTPSNTFAYPSDWQAQFKKLWKVG